MRERDDLRALQVRVPRHRCGAVFGRARHQRLLQARERDQQIGARTPCPHAQVGRHLVVAAASGVQHAGDRPRELEEPALDGGVDVLIARRDRERVAGELRGDGAQPGVDGAMLRGRQHADAAQHARVGARARDVVGAETAVDGEAGGVVLDALGRRRAQTARPDLGVRARAPRAC